VGRVAPVRVAIALGSNLGDRRGHLTWAIDRLGRVLTSLRASALIETDPFDVPSPQPPYLNAAVVGETTLEPEALLETLLALERSRGRQRLADRAPRTLDLDLILYGDLVLEAPGLVVPHPRFRERGFVLQPLAEIAADWIDPKTGKSVRELFNQLQTSNGT
jgi:2-amino-4-hydroxy-6-hydroxymethyldihydropteridine diphosphokinase